MISLIKQLIEIKSKNFSQAYYVAEFVNIANSYKSYITFVYNNKEISVKNVIEVMSLRLDIGDKIVLKANGKDEKYAFMKLKGLII
ncbi:HPr family phosphocarrier protein [Halanaerobium saccharolyticum]|uniref:HPr family phosphocarrier protein n=1 Tax=Halanaerobium saccharolyticum TaxID=43595 RepID=UPI003FCD9D80